MFFWDQTAFCEVPNVRQTVVPRLQPSTSSCPCPKVSARKAAWHRPKIWGQKVEGLEFEVGKLMEFHFMGAMGSIFIWSLCWEWNPAVQQRNGERLGSSVYSNILRTSTRMSKLEAPKGVRYQRGLQKRVARVAMSGATLKEICAWLWHLFTPRVDLRQTLDQWPCNRNRFIGGTYQI
jgi:hypothetical protein